MALDEKTIAFIGAGHITNILLSNLVKARNLRANRLVTSDPNEEKLQQLHDNYGIVMAKDNHEAVEKGDFIFINVRPQVVRIVLDELSRNQLPKNKLIVTLAAGIPISAYESLGEQLPVVRALPNPPSQIGMGIAALAFNPHVTDEQKSDVFELFASLGDYVVLEEKDINAVTALSSPASTYLFFESLIDAGVKAGIDHDMSTKIVYQTIVGSMETWNQRRVSPQDLLNEASTPGGISAESVSTLEQHAFRTALVEAIGKAALKAGELGDAVQESNC
ncbi:MAG: pyrroline-5-carboxylate reductase [Gammaproteobacteria bacterium]|nr:pyrroline-5-carboxylate reductase [Gammaproteobacteria bacterium]